MIEIRFQNIDPTVTCVNFISLKVDFLDEMVYLATPAKIAALTTVLDRVGARTFTWREIADIAPFPYQRLYVLAQEGYLGKSSRQPGKMEAKTWWFTEEAIQRIRNPPPKHRKKVATPQ